MSSCHRRRLYYNRIWNRACPYGPGSRARHLYNRIKIRFANDIPVDDEGKFTEEAGIFSGLDVLGDGNTAVIDHLDERSSIVIVEPYKHKYPYDWRTKKPTIFRATAQWFASVGGFRESAMDAINQVIWTPSQTENRISTMTSSRSDWCISRQRTRAVPIPVFYHVCPVTEF